MLLQMPVLSVLAAPCDGVMRELSLCSFKILVCCMVQQQLRRDPSWLGWLPRHHLLQASAGNVRHTNPGCKPLLQASTGDTKRADSEMQRLDRVFRTFPPASDSAELQMVASGLQGFLKTRDRQTLLDAYTRIASSMQCRRACAQALGC